MALDPSDLFDFDSELGTEQRTIRDVVARFVITRERAAGALAEELIRALAQPVSCKADR